MAELKIKADSGGGTVSLKGPATTTSNAAVQLTLPVDDGTANQYLKTDGSGALSWATVDTSIADDSIVEAKLDVSNAPTNGQFLQAQSGEGGGLKWAAAGKAIQVVNASNETRSISTNSSDDLLTAAITPSGTGSKILILINLWIGAGYTNPNGGIRLTMNHSGISETDIGETSTQVQNATGCFWMSDDYFYDHSNGNLPTLNYTLTSMNWSWVSDPNTTNEVTYKVKTDNFSQLVWNRSEATLGAGAARSSLQLVEIGA